MVAINYANREVSCKIVYYGPGLSGKTTNLQYIHSKVPGNTRGDLISLATDADRTLYFDFLPINIGTINGFTTRFQLYTVPGQVFYNATRKLVLRGVDGLIFVADSQRDKADENVESFNNLKENLADYGYDLGKIPMILQYNKRDLPDVMSVEELNTLLNEKNWPVYESIAHKGKGVFDTLKLIIKMILEKAKKSDTAKKIEEGQESDKGPAETTRQSSLKAPHSDAPQTDKIPISAQDEGEARPVSKEPEAITNDLPSRVAASAVQSSSIAVAASIQPIRQVESAMTSVQTNQEVVSEQETGFEENTMAESHTPNIPASGKREVEEQVSDYASPREYEIEDSSYDGYGSSDKETLPKDKEAKNAEQGREEEDLEDPFALPSGRPKMALSMRAKSKQKKGFLHRLFGRK